MKSKQISSFLIIAAPRSGSNYLCDLLNAQPKLKCYAELFHPDSMPFRVRTLKNLSFKMTTDDRNADPVAFVKKAFSPPRIWHKQYNCVGGKLLLCPYQIKHGADALLNQVDKIIILERKNKLAWYASLRVAEMTGTWFNKPELQSSQAEFNAKDFNERLIYETRLFNTVLSQVSLVQHTTLRVFYEDLGSEACLDKIAKFLGVDPIQTTQKTSWQKSGNVLSCFSNALEVDRFAKANGHLAWL